VRDIEAGMLAGGHHDAPWNGRGNSDRGLASGEYVVRLVIDGKVAATHKTMLVK
jgi:hypothetical protein